MSVGGFGLKWLLVGEIEVCWGAVWVRSSLGRIQFGVEVPLGLCLEVLFYDYVFEDTHTGLLV